VCILLLSRNHPLISGTCSDLEKAVEDLSELLEQPIEADTIPALRQKVTDKSVYVQKRNEILLEDTAKGYLEERWIWNVSVDGL
jgi:ariadne-1